MRELFARATSKTRVERSPAHSVGRYVLTNDSTRPKTERGKEREREKERERDYFNNENSIPARMPRRELRACAMRARSRSRSRRLIRLMSRYCNDFASDLRLFIYSLAVLADRTLITGASRYTNGIKVSAPGASRVSPASLRGRHHVAVANRHANFVDELATRR